MMVIVKELAEKLLLASDLDKFNIRIYLDIERPSEEGKIFANSIKKNQTVVTTVGAKLEEILKRHKATHSGLNLVFGFTTAFVPKKAIIELSELEGVKNIKENAFAAKNFTLVK